MNGTCQLGASSRELKVSERGLKIVLIAVDGIAVIVHKENPINDLSIKQIQYVFSGLITNWKELGGEDEKIIAVTREEGSGTRGAFEDMVMESAAISDACLVQDSNGAVREIIATTQQGIGYISVGLVDERVKPLAIDKVKPTHANLIIHRYRFMRPFLLLMQEDPAGNIKKFIDYVLSDEGQDIFRHSGLIPAIDIHRD
jgi:phosphate transport system substrate-binding protein